MRKHIALLILAGYFGNAEADSPCATALPDVQNSFHGLHGELTTENGEQLRLIQTCATANSVCVLTTNPSTQGYTVVAGEKASQDGAWNARNSSAVSALSVFKNQKYGKICALLRYSGGSAAAWSVEAWRVKDGTAAFIDGSLAATLVGENYTAAGLLQAASKPLNDLR